MKSDLAQFIKHLKLEAVALAILMIVLTNESGYSLWVLPVTFLLFDVGMVGYLKNPVTGALFYNLTHSLTIPTIMIATGSFFSLDVVAVIGFCWTFHIAVDRALGFGLKNKTSFHNTHLGKIKKSKK